MDGLTLGVFGTDALAKQAFEAAVAKKSEGEGVTVYHRLDSGRRVSLLDDTGYPERIQGCSGIASIVDHALYLFPKTGKLSAPDGELAVLLQSFKLPGSIISVDNSSSSDLARSSFRGTALESYRFEERPVGSSILDVSDVVPRVDLPRAGTLIYVDRAFNVKGVGTVALGFVLSGKVSVHDKLRPLPLPKDKSAEVRGIQINDEDFESSGRGIRVGISLRGVDARDLERCSWLADDSFELRDRLTLEFERSPFYRQQVEGREMHLQLPGELVTASFSEGEAPGQLTAALPLAVPVWPGMRATVVDLNGKGLRVAGGGVCKV